MPWTLEQKLDALMRLPWSLSFTRSEHGNYLVARVAEVADAMATGENDRAAAIALYESLRASLLVRLEHGDELPLPANTVLPWLNRPEPQAEPLVVTPELGDRDAWVRPVFRNTGAYQQIDAALAPV
ncbi:MAG TPA: hypothetical protein VFZ21_02600 [Gemmatimonadaceae bacterium]|nr:hypothetical protein [Gemmatimonadaceae bacterium]